MYRIQLKLVGLHGMALIILCGTLAVACPAQQPAGVNPQTVFPSAPIREQPETSVPLATPRIALADLAWLQGQWNGNWGPRMATQTWSAVRAGTMLGTLQIVENGKTLVVEFFAISDTPTGAQLRLLHFTSSLTAWEKAGPAALSLMSADAKKFVFQNQSAGEPQQIVLTRGDPDTYTDRSEIMPETGEPQTTEITFHRQKPPSAGSGAHR